MAPGKQIAKRMMQQTAHQVADLVKTFLAGVTAGIALAIIIGPALFSLIQTSLRNGFKSGVALASGIFLSDGVCVALAYLGASQFFTDPKNKLLIGVLGGIILIIFGTYNAAQKEVHADEEEIQIPAVNIPLTFLKGFFLNIVNPFVFIYWIGIVGLVSSNFSFNHSHIIVFFAGTLLTVLATDITKCFLAHKIAQYLKPGILTKVNRFAGIILIICGIVMIVRVIIT